MSSPERCHHIKTNGTQCGSPALRDHRFCYYHQQYRPSSVPTYWKESYPLGEIAMPEFEDAHSVQFVIRQVVKLTLEQRLDHKTASLVLYALQIASSNLKRLALETPDPQQVCVEPDQTKIAGGDSAIVRHGEEQAAQQKQLAEHKQRLKTKPAPSLVIAAPPNNDQKNEPQAEQKNDQNNVKNDEKKTSTIDNIQASLPVRRLRRTLRARPGVAARSSRGLTGASYADKSVRATHSVTAVIVT